MNNWQAWIVPVIALGVWILSHLLRGSEQDKKAPPRERLPGENPPGRAKEPLTDLDRFLREVNRRRQNAEERRPGPAAKPSPVLTAQPVAERPRPSMPKPTRALPPRRQASRPAPAAPSKAATTSTFQPEPLTVLPADSKPLHAISLPASEQTPLAFPTSSEIIRIATPAAMATAAKMAPAIKQASSRSSPAPFLTLLSSAENVKAAMVLREIFDPPLCRRRRRT
jgi:hypothetical protein